jgi:apolipoprotein N-acyltransferase
VGAPGASAIAISTGACWLLAALHGLIFAAVFPPLSLWLLAFVVPVPLAMLALRARSMWQLLPPLMAAQMLAWLWLLRWIIPVTVVGYPVLALYLSTHTLIFAWVLRRIAGSPRLLRVPMTLLLPLLWTASEYFRGEIAFNGYPWYMLGQPLIDWLSFAQSADLFGAYFISFLAVAPAGIALDLIGWISPAANDAQAPPRGERRKYSVAIGAMLLLVANVGYGRWRMQQQATLSDGPRILAIQTNLPQDNKIGWTREQRDRDIPEFMRLTREAFSAVGGRERVDVIVWPETMVYSAGYEQATTEQLPLFGENGRDLLQWAQTVEAMGRDELRVPMLVGSEAWVDADIVTGDDGMARLIPGKEYNSAYLLQGRPPYQRYDKAVLTPFGETMPYISNWPWLEQRLLALGASGMEFNLDANPQVQVLELHSEQGGGSSAWRLGIPICFEDTVAWLCREMAYAGGRKRADVFVNISNDGWFGPSEGDRILHAKIARFRCIENRTPMVRCVNTGVSVQVDSCGRVVAAAGGSGYGVINQPGSVLANVQIDSRVTLFGRIGGLFPAACLLLTLGILILTFVRRSKPVITPGVEA